MSSPLSAGAIAHAQKIAEAAGEGYVVRIEADGTAMIVPPGKTGMPMPADWFRTGEIYFLHCPETKTLKIGTSSNTTVRVRSIAAGMPFPLTLLGVIDGSFQMEADLHRRFADQRLNGEWFRATDELLAAVHEILAAAKR